MSLITNIEKCNEFTLISRKIKITKYNCDSGNRDLSSEKSYKGDIPFVEILQKAINLNAFLIVKSSYINDNRPGAWYIKGYNKRFTYEQIKSKIDENVKNKKYTKRICYLITYLK